jgi:quercetin dioxygenase-like cupin family protein
MNRLEAAMTESIHISPRPIARTAGECERRWFYGGGIHTWKVTAADSDGSFLLFEDEMDQGKTTPLHTHPADETMYVVEGQIRMHLDGTDHDVDAGGVAVAPRGVPHAFLVLSATARVLWLHTPATCEAFYLAASEPYDEAGEHVVDFDRVRAAGQSAGGIDIIGPPPFAMPS